MKCNLCHNNFPPDRMSLVGDRWLCPNCTLVKTTCADWHLVVLATRRARAMTSQKEFESMSPKERETYLAALRRRKSTIQEQIVSMNMQLAAVEGELYTLDPPKPAPQIVFPPDKITVLKPKEEPVPRWDWKSECQLEVE